MMKIIDIRPQPPLSLSRLFNLTLHGIRYRLFRSAVTVAVIAVAVSFLMNVFVQQRVCERAMQRCRQEAKILRLAAAWAVRLQEAGSSDALMREAADDEEAEIFAAEARRLAGWDDDAVRETRRDAAVAMRFLAFLDDLDYGRRRRLVGDRQGAAIFAWLQEKKNCDHFFVTAAEMKSVRLPLSAAELLAFFSQRWPILQARLERLRAARQEAIARLHSRLQGRSMLEALANAAGEFGEEIRQAGFAFPALEAPLIAQQAAMLADAAAIETTLAWPETRKALAARLGILPSEVNTDKLWEVLSAAEGAAWYLRKAQSQP
ncbi:MAG: hypothetical protein N3A66_10175, partial [Planctomycetota bacterium]|nr:hypothetical protein [Planctomycetota bacterium]